MPRPRTKVTAMPTVAAEKFTVDDYRAMPEGPPYYQLVEGELIMSPAPNFLHQVIARNIFRLLDGYLRRRPLGECYFAPVDFFLDEENVFQPDVFYISQSRKGRIQPDGVHGTPDLVVEILSPSNAKLDLKRKRPLYAKHGVQELWLVDPVLEQIHRYDFSADVAKPVRIIDSEETFETPLFPDLVVSATEVFRK